jgi:hypothetical protein
MFEAPFQALPGTSGLQKAPGPAFCRQAVRIRKGRSGPSAYKAESLTFKAPVAAPKDLRPAMFPTIPLKCCARNLNQSFMLASGLERESY